MKFSTTLLFSALFGVVLFFYLRLQTPPLEMEVEQLQRAPQPTQLLAVDEGDSLVWFQIQNLEKNEMVTFVRERGEWELKYPVNYDADDHVVDALIQKLVSTDIVEYLTPVKDWEEYGLLRPPLKVGIETKNSNNRRYLYLGDTSPVGNMIFARWDGEEDYFLIDQGVKEIFSHSLYSIRDKRIFKAPVHEISKVMIRIGSESYKIIRQGDVWLWDNPHALKGAALDFVQLSDLFDQLETLFIKDFIDDPEGDTSVYGFSSLGNTIKVWTTENESYSLTIGNSFATRSAYYAKRNAEDAVILVDHDRLRTLMETFMLMAGASAPL